MFESEEHAQFMAMCAALELFNNRVYDKRSAKGYRRMTGSELALALDQLDVTPTYFAEIVGVPQARVINWLDGTQDIPHSVHLLVRMMLERDDNFEVAERITRECLEK